MGNRLSKFCCGRSTSHKPITSSPTHHVSSQPLLDTSLPKPVQTVDASTSNPQISHSDDSSSEIDLDKLIHHIDHFLSAVNTVSSVPSTFNLSDLVGSTYLKHFSTLFDGISKGAHMLSDEKTLMSSLLGEAKSEALTALKGIGKLSWAAAGFLVLAHVIERFEKISSNQNQCLDLLKAMSNLAKLIRQLKRMHLKSEMEDKLEEAVVLIAQGAIICCSQMQRGKPTRLALVSKNAEDLAELHKQIDRMHRELDTQIHICVLDKVQNRVTRAPERPYPKYAVGIKEQVEQVIDLLELESDKRAVAVIVHGFGGSGKTTVADAVVASLNLDSYKYSKVNLNENYQKPDIGKLQTKIVQDLTGHSQPDIRECQSGLQDLDIIIQRDPVLIYIDNVLKENDLKNLLPVSLDRSRKIRLLLTARDAGVSAALSGSCSIKVHPMKPVSENSATELLCKKSMDKQFEPEQICKMAEIAKKCCSSPLFLNVAAGYLYRRGYEDDAFERVFEWFETGKPFILKEEREHDSMFGFAFGDLHQSARDAFLDVCYFFYRWEWTVVECIVGTEELKTLEDAAFITREFNTVCVHDVLVAFGRSRGGEKTEGLRLKSTKDVSKVLEDTENTNKIKGIWLVENKDLFQLSAKVLEQMHSSLRVLALGDWTSITDGKCNKTFDNLRYFQAGDVPALPFTVDRLPMLTVMSNFSGQDMGMAASTTLRVMALSRRKHCEKFEIHPQTFEKLKKLRILQLLGFPELSLATFAAFRKLGYLDLSGCGVVSIPDSLVNLCELHTLKLTDCRRLETLPERIGELPHLAILNLQGCIHLKQLPKSIVSLSSLSYLGLRRCQNIEELPENFALLNSLTYLDLGGCRSLKFLPGNLGKLTSLAWLDLTSCEVLRSVPHSIGRSTHLSLIGCSRLSEISDEFCDSMFVQALDLTACWSLRLLPSKFHKLTQLRRVKLSSCESLLRLPDCFHELSFLELLNLNGCSHLEELCSEFESIPSLETLDLSDCKSLKGIWMDRVAKIQSLRSVRIKGSYWLQKQWQQIKNEKEEWHFVINAGQEEGSEFLRKASSAFFREECLLVDSTGKQVGPATSFLPDSTLVLLFGPLPVAYWFAYDWELVSDNLKILRGRSKGMQIIYIDRNQKTALNEDIFGIFNRLPDGSLRLIAPTNLGAILATMTDILVDDGACIMFRTSVETDDEGREQFSPWENISNLLAKSILKAGDGESERYLHIKQLAAGTAAEAQGCNIELLRALLVTKETDFLLRNTAQQVKVDDLKGKTVLLFISRMEVSEMEISMMKAVYLNRHHDFEIVWIPVVDSNNTDNTWGCYVRNARSMSWLAIPNPWLMDSAVLHFLIEYWYFQEESMLMVVDGNGTIVNKNAMGMVKKWGIEAYPFTTDKKKELKTAQQRQVCLKSSLEFLLEISDYRLPKAEQGQGKLMCLLGGDPHEIPDFVSKLNSAFRGIKDNFHFLFVGRSDGYIEEIDEEAAILEKSREWMSIPTLAMPNVCKFWYRSRALFTKETLAMEHSESLLRLRRLLLRLRFLNKYSQGVWMLVLDENGGEVTTGRGKELVEELCKDGEDEGALSLELHQSLESSGVGGLKEALQRRFNDHVILPQHHPHHSLIQFQPHHLRLVGTLVCDLCDRRFLEEECFYSCAVCERTDICKRCFDNLERMQ